MFYVFRYHLLYQQCKGNQFRNKRILIEYIHKKKAERLRAKQLSDQSEAMRQRKRESRANRAKRLEERKKAIIDNFNATVAAASKPAPVPVTSVNVAKPPTSTKAVDSKAKSEVKTVVMQSGVAQEKPKETTAVKSSVSKAASKIAPAPKIASKTPAPTPNVPPPTSAKSVGKKFKH